MDIYIKIVAAITLIVLGVAVDRFWIHRKRGELKSSVNTIPNSMPSCSTDEIEMLKIYMDEWKTVIGTQMHFNDLILRFRSVVLTAFVAFMGAIVALEKTLNLFGSERLLIVGIPLTLWIAAFILDFFYYHRLLLGAVGQAMKFDDSVMKKYGLFGLTNCISNHVHPPTSRVLVCIFYIFPFLAALFLVPYLMR